ncbi:right-handed parallel beta-helix repeat-containing protein [Oceanithermus sp.]|uniref:right-handed parallel beta-helix repeat-containing protein n=1 Tax=Oceanithermus sp. TaxID=2268145 RepID=UPI002579F906|nr:right-handed parallel beta-helix repeat-containing protein [Oceanithermus sp.]
MSRTLKNRVPARLGWILMVFVLWIHAGVVEAQTIRSFQREYTNAGSEFRGNLLSIGNTLVTCTSCDPNSSGIQNGNRAMGFVDVDADASTTSSSRATLSLPPGSQVEYAALVWGARTTTASGNKTLKFKLPGSASYTTVTSDWTEYITGQYANGDPYAAYADVTSLLQGLPSPDGDYWAADIDAVVGNSDGLGFYGGWALLVVYSSANETYRTITVDAGYAKLAGGGSIDIDITNLDTPVTGSYLFRLSAIVWEGDDGITGDQLLVGPVPGTLSNVSDAQNPSNNFWNSSISHLGAQFTAKNPNYKNQLGFDADTVELGNLPPGIDTIRTRYLTNGDHFFPQVLGTSVGLAIIKGTIYEDVNGDGSLTDAVAVPNVTVTLYQDDGDGVPDAGDTLVAGQTVSTTAQGEYSFQNIPDGDYWVVVDSRTIAPAAGFNAGFAQGDVWAEQTYGAGGAWGGALCDADADGTTAAVARTADGVCFGGRRGQLSDDASALTSAEHVAKVGVHGSIVTGVDFGFSFNVVTNTNDQDDDAAANRTAQGSLRQFLQNANAVAGGNAMRFTPAVPLPSGQSWWTVAVTPGDPLPAITDGDTTVDGAAFDYASASSPRDSNAGSAPRSCTTVGVDQVPFTPIELPELEVRVDASVDWGLKVDTSGSNVVLRRLAVYGSGTTSITDPADAGYNPDPTGDVFVVQSGSGLVVNNVLVGLRANAGDPGPGARTRGNGIHLYGQLGTSVSPGWIVANNLVSRVGHQGIFVYGANAGSGTIQQNEVSHANWLGRWNADGISVEDDTGGSQILENCVVSNNGPGLDSWQGTGGNVWRNNTVRDNGHNGDNNPYFNGTDNVERYGARIMNSGNVFERNVVSGNFAAGVVVTRNHDPNRAFFSTNNRISHNSFFGNGSIAIDLDQTHGNDWNDNPVGDGVSANDGATSNQEQNLGLDYPVLTKVELDGSSLTLEGFIGTPASPLQPAAGATWTLELYLADDDGNNDGEVFLGDGAGEPHGEGRVYVIAVTLQSGDFAGGRFSKTLTVSGLSTGASVTAIVIDDQNNTSEFSANARVVPPGIPVSGGLYHDLEPDGLRNGGDAAVAPADLDPAAPPTLYVKRFSDPDGDCTNGFATPAEEVAAVDAAGGYAFAAVRAGRYCLVLSESNDPNDATPYDPQADGWLYVNPPAGVLPLVVTAPQVEAQTPSGGHDFGLFHGALVTGTVFYDTGDGTGTPNNAVQDGSEPGVPSVPVTAGDGTHRRTVLTDADGRYAVYVPAGWGTVSLYHDERPASGYNFPGTVQQAGDWTDATAATDPDHTAFAQLLGDAASLAGGQLAERNFGVVRDGAFRSDQQGTAASPGAVTYVHTYKPGTQGVVTLKRAGGDYVYQVRVDADCNGNFDASEPWRTLSPSEQPTFSVTDAWPRDPDGSFRACTVEVRVLVPDGEPEGAVDLAQLTAELAWDQNPGVVEVDAVVDTTTVRVQGGLGLTKVVRNVTQGVPAAGYGTAVEARPGDVLEYCIRYVNDGTEDVTDVTINDPVPFFADVVSDAYDTDPAADETLLWTDASGTSHRISAAADGDAGEWAAGLVTLRAEAQLRPGAGGELCYRVRVR